MAAITLTPNVLHCVRTGLPLGRLPEHLDKVNQALTSGKFTAGMHTGHIRASDTSIEQLKARGVSLKRYYWGKNGANNTARRIAAHNEATLQQHGFSADPSTKSKGTLSKRQYGVYAEPQPKVVENVDVMDLMQDMTAVPAEPTVPAIVMPEPPKATLPVPEEYAMKGSSGWATYRSRAMRAGMDKAAISAAWKAGKDNIAQALNVSAVVRAAPVVKAQPKAVKPSAGQPSTIRVDANALAATLATLNDAKIVSNEGTEFTVQYVA